MSIREPGPAWAGDTPNAPEPEALTWTRVQLRKQVQRLGTAWAPVACPADPAPETDRRPPLADMEAEP